MTEILRDAWDGEKMARAFVALCVYMVGLFAVGAVAIYTQPEPSVSLADAIQVKAPGAQFVIETTADGTEHLRIWSHPTVPEPDAATMAAWKVDADVIAAVRSAETTTHEERLRAILELLCADPALTCDAAALWTQLNPDP